MVTFYNNSAIHKERLVCTLQRWGGENKIGAAALAEGADSINAWLAHLFDDTVTSISDGHKISADSGAVLKGANILSSYSGISHVCPTQTPDKERGGNKSSAGF